MAYQREARAGGGGLPGPVIGLGFLIVTVIVLGYVYSQIEPGGDDGGTSDTTETVDPFADVPPETPPPPRGGAGQASPASDPFAAVSDLTETPIWSAAAQLAADAEELTEQAALALDDGDREESKDLSGRARAKYEEALSKTDAFEEQMIAKHGETNAGVREISRVRQRWRREVVAIKKATGM